jgi:hypothetical protein
MSWYNADGLFVKFGAAQGDPASAGEYKSDGPLRVIEVNIPALASIGAVATPTILDDVTVVPKGAFIEKIEVVVDTAADSAADNATLNIGLVRTDRTTELDYDGFVTAGAQTTIDAVGDVVEYIQGGTAHGALIGTALANNGLLTAGYGTAAYTAGAVRVRVYYRVL